MFIEVMYASRTRAGKFEQRRVHIDQVATLPTSNALFVILSSETTRDRSRRVIDGLYYERVTEKWGDDKTVYIRRIVDGVDSVLLEEYGKTFQWKTVDNPRAERSAIMEHPFDKREDVITFLGVMLSQAEWEEAQQQFIEEMH